MLSPIRLLVFDRHANRLVTPKLGFDRIIVRLFTLSSEWLNEGAEKKIATIAGKIIINIVFIVFSFKGV